LTMLAVAFCDLPILVAAGYPVTVALPRPCSRPLRLANLRGRGGRACGPRAGRLDLLVRCPA